MARIHELKCDCRPFSDLVSGRKTCEVRENDRLYEVDDILHLREGIRTPDGYTYTGRETKRIVTHVQCGYGLPDGVVVLSVRAIESASQPGIDALATAMHHAAIKYASGDLVDFQHEAREFLLASQPGGGEAVETLMMLMRANPNAYVSDILPHAEDYLARAAPSAGNGEAKGDDRKALTLAAVNCPHEIDSNRVILHYDGKQSGPNALAQLVDRLCAAMSASKEGA